MARPQEIQTCSFHRTTRLELSSGLCVTAAPIYWQNRSMSWLDPLGKTLPTAMQMPTTYIIYIFFGAVNEYWSSLPTKNFRGYRYDWNLLNYTHSLPCTHCPIQSRSAWVTMECVLKALHSSVMDWLFIRYLFLLCVYSWCICVLCSYLVRFLYGQDVVVFMLIRMFSMTPLLCYS